MRIGFFTDTFLPNIDGVVTSIQNARGFLTRHGHDVYVFSAGSKSDAAQNADENVFFFRSIAFPPYPMYKLALFPYLGAVSKAREKKLDVVHCHAITSMGLAARRVAGQLDLPLVGTFHTMITDATQYVTRNQWIKSRASKVVWRGISLFYKPFDAVTAPSQVTADLLEKHGVARVRVVPNGVDVHRFSPDLDSRVVRSLLGLEDDEAMVLVAGRLGFEKNVDVVIQAAQRVLKKRKARFVVTGDGPARPSLQALAKKAGVRDAFEFEGFVNSKALPYYYAAADVLVSASAFETQGLSILEAMAAGCPAVGANALAIPEAIADGRNGFLFEPFNASDCADKVLAVLDADSRQSSNLSRAARRTAEGYSLEKTGGEWLDVYESVMG
ncbi:glycosyltransferase [Candidatus Micrarchaeota archaeon]|nr:glycosyltransferase [Candidatus Micrarchaeota archaeon]